MTFPNKEKRIQSVRISFLLLHVLEPSEPPAQSFWEKGLGRREEPADCPHLQEEEDSVIKMQLQIDIGPVLK